MATRKQSRNPNLLTDEELGPFWKILEDQYAAEGGNGAALARWLDITPSAVSQLVARKTRLSIDTCRKVAAKVGSGLTLGVRGTEPAGDMRTIESDPASLAALAHAARRWNFPRWLTSALARTVVPDGWPALTPEVCYDLASVWLKWEGQLGSSMRPKAIMSSEG